MIKSNEGLKKNIKIQNWSTNVETMVLTLPGNSKIIVIVYDVTNKDIFQNVEKWLKRVKEKSSRRCCFCLVRNKRGNKIDLQETRIINTKEAENFAKKNNILFF